MSAATPRTDASAIPPIPTAVPRMCGRARANPNSVPVVQRIRLFGPGVMTLISENPTRAAICSMPPTLIGCGPAVLYDPAMGAAAGSGFATSFVRAWTPAVPGVREVLHARFPNHAYPPHTHDTWTVFIVDDGGIRYDLDGKARGADRSTVGVLPPHVVHDGRPSGSIGYRKRVLYVETSVLPERLIGAAVDRPALGDPVLR